MSNVFWFVLFCFSFNLVLFSKFLQLRKTYVVVDAKLKFNYRMLKIPPEWVKWAVNE